MGFFPAPSMGGGLSLASNPISRPNMFSEVPENNRNPLNPGPRIETPKPLNPNFTNRNNAALGAFMPQNEYIQQGNLPPPPAPGPGPVPSFVPSTPTPGGIAAPTPMQMFSNNMRTAVGYNPLVQRPDGQPVQPGPGPFIPAPEKPPLIPPAIPPKAPNPGEPGGDWLDTRAPNERGGPIMPPPEPGIPPVIPPFIPPKPGGPIDNKTPILPPVIPPGQEGGDWIDTRVPGESGRPGPIGPFPWIKTPGPTPPPRVVNIPGIGPIEAGPGGRNSGYIPSGPAPERRLPPGMEGLVTNPGGRDAQIYYTPQLPGMEGRPSRGGWNRDPSGRPTR